MKKLKVKKKRRNMSNIYTSAKTSIKNIVQVYSNDKRVIRTLSLYRFMPVTFKFSRLEIQPPCN